MKHITLNGHQLVPKNNLQKAAQQYLASIDRTLIEAGHLGLFKATVLYDFERLNREHPRCAPLKVSWHELALDDWMLSGAGFSHFIIYNINKTYPS